MKIIKRLKNAGNCKNRFFFLQRAASFHQRKELSSDERFGQEVDVLVVFERLEKLEDEWRVDWKKDFSFRLKKMFEIQLQTTKFYLDMPPLASLNDAMFVDAFQGVIIIVVLHQLNMCITTAAEKLETLQRVDLEFGEAHLVDFRDYAGGCCVNSWIWY